MASTSVVFDILARDRASDKFDKFGNSVDKSSSKMSKLSGVMKGAAKVGAIGLGIAVVGAGKAMFEMTKNAMEDEASQRKLAVALRNSVDATDAQVASVERYISKQGELLGVTDDELRPAFQRLVEATGSVEEAQRQMDVAMDVSAGTGKSLKTVTEALMKANNGTTASLSKLGLKTKDAQGNTLSLDEAMKKMADTFEGQAAAKADTLEGKMDRLKLMFDETKEAIGARLIPIITTLADWFMDKALPAIRDFGGEMKDRLQPIIERVGSWIADTLVPAVKRFAEDALPAARNMLGSVKDALKDAQPFFDTLGDIVVDVLIPFLGKLAKTVLPILGDALKLVGKALGKVGELGRWMWNNVLQPVFKLFVEAISRVLIWFGKMLQTIGKVPKMGWVGDLGDKLVRTGEDANELGDKIKKIPDSHNTKITMDASQANSVMASLETRLNNLADHLQGMFGGSSSRSTTSSSPGSPKTTAGMPRMAPGAVASGGLTVNIHGALDPVAVGKQFEQILVRHVRTSGRPLQVRTIP